MKPELLEQLFGKETAKIYFFDGVIPEGEELSAFVTEEFAKAAGTNLINCVVTTIQESTLVYTHTDYGISDEKFRFYIDLPLPEPEVTPEVPPNEPDSGGEQ